MNPQALLLALLSLLPEPRLPVVSQPTRSLVASLQGGQFIYTAQGPVRATLGTPRLVIDLANLAIAGIDIQGFGVAGTPAGGVVSIQGVALGTPVITTPAAGGVQDVNLLRVSGSAITIGQAVMAASLPVVVASNQSNLPVNLAQIGASAFAQGQRATAGAVTVIGPNDANLAVGGSNGTGTALTGFPNRVAYSDGTNTQDARLALGTPGPTAGTNVAQLAVSTEGTRGTFVWATTVRIVGVAGSTDLLCVTGSGTRTGRIVSIIVSGVATAAGAQDFFLQRRSTATVCPANCTDTTLTSAIHDTTDAASSLAVHTFGAAGDAAAATVGTPVGGRFGAQTGTLPTAAGSAIPIVPVVWDFTQHNEQAVVLRGTAQFLCLNVNASYAAGAAVHVEVHATEE